MMTTDTTPERLTVTNHRSVTVLGVDDKPAVELTLEDGAVKVDLKPKNGQRRAPVALADLKAAVAALEA